jgi:SAM-dependent methyltransferase
MSEATTDARKQGQTWDAFWIGERSVLEEIQVRDFFGGRQYIVKYVPRNGIVLEAGCGLGRYVFYLRELGIRTIGLDIGEATLNAANAWAKDNIEEIPGFLRADVRKLPLKAGSISGYISLGVIEHFIEGPEAALREAFRVLRPGGVAIITTPNLHSLVFQKRNFKKRIKSIIRIFNKSQGETWDLREKQTFFQYEYGRRELARFVKDAGFDLLISENCDLKYPLREICNGWKKLPTFLSGSRYIFPLLGSLEHTPLRRFGGQSIVVAIKPGNVVRCFACGKEHSYSGEKDFPMCDRCIQRLDPSTWSAYLSRRSATFSKTARRAEEPGSSAEEKQVCQHCGREFTQNSIWADHGFSMHICKDCVTDPFLNMTLSVRYLKESWVDYNAGERKNSFSIH